MELSYRISEMNISFSHVYFNHIISKMIQNDSRFAILNRPIHEIISFFQNIFLCIIQNWMQIYPHGFTNEKFTHTENEQLKRIIHEIDPQIQISIPFVFDFFKEALHRIHKNMSSQLYQEMLLSALHYLREREHTIVHHPNSNKYAVIMDPRYDLLMEAVIRNFMYFMNKQGWNLMIFGYSGYRDKILADFPTALFVPIHSKYIMVDQNGNPNMSVQSYNDIFLSKSFWESIPGTHIAVFQKDCIMYKMFDESLFLSYDFAGANYSHEFDESYYSGGINGGFSLRNKHAMIECINSFTWENIISYNKKLRELDGIPYNKQRHVRPYHLDTRNEDVFFTNACEMLRRLMPDVVLRNRLAIEAVDMLHTNATSLNTCVYHGWNKNYHDLSFAKTLLEKSPLFFRYLHNVSD